MKFACDIDGNPMPTVQWMYNGKPVPASKDIKVNNNSNADCISVLSSKTSKHFIARYYSKDSVHCTVV